MKAPCCTVTRGPCGAARGTPPAGAGRSARSRVGARAMRAARWSEGLLRRIGRRVMAGASVPCPQLSCQPHVHSARPGLTIAPGRATLRTFVLGGKRNVARGEDGARHRGWARLRARDVARPAACGADVVVNVLRNREAAEATAEAVRKHGVQTCTARANVSERAAINRLRGGMAAAMGGVDIVVRS